MTRESYPLTPVQVRILREHKSVLPASLARLAETPAPSVPLLDDQELSALLSRITKNLAKAGDYSRAWSVYQNDPGGSADVTYTQFEQFMRNLYGKGSK